LKFQSPQLRFLTLAKQLFSSEFACNQARQQPTGNSLNRYRSELATLLQTAKPQQTATPHLPQGSASAPP
jgi:hypothetical protein